MEVIQLEKYIKQHRLLFKPEFLINVLLKFNKMKDSMVQKVAFKKSNKEASCKYCDAVKASSNGLVQFCKKHRAVHDWKDINISRTGVGKLYGGYNIQIYNRYVIVSMPTDPNGVYVIWVGKDDEYSVYCMSKEYFPGIFENGFNINDLLNENHVVVYKNLQVYWDENNPRLESIK